MNKRFTKFVVVFLALLLILPLNVAFAQDDTMMEDKIVCDSSLILTLFIAEYDLGYEAMMDVSVFEKGQFTDLFDTMMMMDDGMMDEESMDDEAMMDETTDDSMMDDQMMEDMVTLVPVTIEDEDPACTELRTALDTFIYDHYTHELMMAEDDM